MHNEVEFCIVCLQGFWHISEGESLAIIIMLQNNLSFFPRNNKKGCGIPFCLLPQLPHSLQIIPYYHPKVLRESAPSVGNGNSSQCTLDMPDMHC